MKQLLILAAIVFVLGCQQPVDGDWCVTAYAGPPFSTVGPTEMFTARLTNTGDELVDGWFWFELQVEDSSGTQPYDYQPSPGVIAPGDTWEGQAGSTGFSGLLSVTIDRVWHSNDGATWSSENLAW